VAATNFRQRSLSAFRDLQHFFGPGLQHLLHFAHELVGQGAVDQAWSKLSERRQMERMAMASSITTGVFSIVPTPMMATCGWLMMGVPTRLP